MKWLWAALGAVVGVVGLVACLSLAEALDEHWLYIPGIVFFFGALLAGEVAVWGVRGIVLLTAFMAAVVLQRSWSNEPARFAALDEEQLTSAWVS